MGFGLRLRLGQAHLAILAEGCCEICCSHRMKSLPELSWLECFRVLYSHDRCFPQGGWQPDVYVRFQVAEGLAFLLLRHVTSRVVESVERSYVRQLIPLTLAVCRCS